MSASIMRIVLTGGPCAGKSTALGLVRDHLERHRNRVYVVPEASTLLLSGGIRVRDVPLEQTTIFQRGIVRLQQTMEEAFITYARARGESAVLLCDRGILDGAAYLPTWAWQAILQAEGLQEAELLEARYHGVVHLVTVAHGEEGYSTASNPSRYEDLHGARQVCDRLREVWRAHPRHRIIDHHVDFTVKMHRVLCAVSELVGVPAPELG